MTVAVVGDGAVDLLGVLSAKQMGAERIIASHPSGCTSCRLSSATLPSKPVTLPRSPRLTEVANPQIRCPVPLG